MAAADAHALPPLARLRRRVRSAGIAATLRKAFADHVFRRSTSVIVEYRPGWGNPGRAALHPDWLGFVIVRAGDPLPALGDWLAWRETDFTAMRDAGKLGIFALRSGVAVGCVWVALGDHHDPASREFYAVGPNEAYHYCWMVEPAARSTNVALPLCRHVIATLADMGIERQFGVVDRVNRASYLIQQRFGYRECGVRVRHYVIFGSRFTRVSQYTGVLGPVAG